MHLQALPHTDLAVSRMALGCMTQGGAWTAEPVTAEDAAAARAAVRAALDGGINFFDHADIYGRGRAEQAFATIWAEVAGLRDRIVLQSKCGIRFAGDGGPDAPHRFDFSREHIVRSVDGILGRLQTDRLDILLLHRPDPLVEPEEVAAAFDTVHKAGKVRFFGVSNHTTGQMELLRRFVRQPIVVNQLQFSLLHTTMLDSAVTANQGKPGRDQDILEYCRLHGITVQAWGPLHKGHIVDRPPPAPDHPLAIRIAQLQPVVQQLAQAKGVSGEAIALAWILRHPARIQPIVGTRNPQRIRAACQADTVTLSREEWYRLYIAGRGEKLP